MICDDCRSELKITRTSIDLGKGMDEIEISYCSECKVIWEITVSDYKIHELAIK